MALKLKEVDNLRMSNHVTVRFYSSKNALNDFKVQVVIEMLRKLHSIYCGIFNAKKKISHYSYEIQQNLSCRPSPSHNAHVYTRLRWFAIHKHIENMADKPRKIFQTSKVWS